MSVAHIRDRLEKKRRIHIDCENILGKSKLRRHDTNDKKRIRSQSQRSADERSIAAKSPLPELMAQNNDSFALLLFVLCKRPADRGVDTQCRKQTCRS